MSKMRFAKKISVGWLFLKSALWNSCRWIWLSRISALLTRLNRSCSAQTCSVVVLVGRQKGRGVGKGERDEIGGGGGGEGSKVSVPLSRPPHLGHAEVGLVRELLRRLLRGPQRLEPVPGAALLALAEEGRGPAGRGEGGAPPAPAALPVRPGLVVRGLQGPPGGRPRAAALAETTAHAEGVDTGV
jgi:hypothetical protein